MKLDATVTVFEVSPIADPARGGRWCSIQLWRDQGTPRVTQVCDYKWRLVTPADRDASAEIEATIRTVLAIARTDAVTGVPRKDSIVLDTVKTAVEV